jgi:hypothetical protein
MSMTPNLTPIRELQVCAKHPKREASLRCIRCDRLMCTDCIVRTSVGYICKECSRRTEDKFFAAANQDYVLQAGTCFVIMAAIAALLTQVPFASSFFGVFLGPIAGGLVGEAALRVTGRRRGRYTDVIGTSAVGLGGLIGHVVTIFVMYQQDLNQYGADMQAMYIEAQGTVLSHIITGTVLDIWFLIFLGLACAGAYTRLRGQI